MFYFAYDGEVCVTTLGKPYLQQGTSKAQRQYPYTRLGSESFYHSTIKPLLTRFVNIINLSSHAAYGENCTDSDGVYKFDFLQRPYPVTEYGVWPTYHPEMRQVVPLTKERKEVREDFTFPQGTTQ